MPVLRAPRLSENLGIFVRPEGGRLGPGWIRNSNSEQRTGKMKKPKLPDHVTTRLMTQPLDRSNVSQRKGGGGKSLSYLKAHYVRRIMNEVFGVDGWTCETLKNDVLHSHTYKDRFGKNKLEVINQALVRVTLHTDSGNVSKDGTGVGNGEATLYGEDGRSIDAFELSAKEAESDAFKRAAMNLGDVFGLALYDPDQARVVDKPEFIEDAQDLNMVTRIKDCESVEQLTQLYASLTPSTAAIYLPTFTEAKKSLS